MPEEIKTKKLEMENSVTEILANFKPTIKKMPIEVVQAYKKMTEKEFFQTYNSCSITMIGKHETIVLHCTLEQRVRKILDNLEHIDLEIEPSEMGLSKSSEILLSAREQTVYNEKTRKFEDGIFLWKTTVSIPSSGEYANMWLYWSDGRLWIMDLFYPHCFTTEFNLNLIMDRNLKLSDIEKSYPKRILISNRTYRLLKQQRFLHYCSCEFGSEEILQ